MPLPASEQDVGSMLGQRRTTLAQHRANVLCFVSFYISATTAAHHQILVFPHTNVGSDSVFTFNPVDAMPPSRSQLTIPRVSVFSFLQLANVA